MFIQDVRAGGWEVERTGLRVAGWRWEVGAKNKNGGRRKGRGRRVSDEWTGGFKGGRVRARVKGWDETSMGEVA